jgi:hypothetical protein
MAISNEIWRISINNVISLKISVWRNGGKQYGERKRISSKASIKA